MRRVTGLKNSAHSIYHFRYRKGKKKKTEDSVVLSARPRSRGLLFKCQSSMWRSATSQWFLRLRLRHGNNYQNFEGINILPTIHILGPSLQLGMRRMMLRTINTKKALLGERFKMLLKQAHGRRSFCLLAVKHLVVMRSEILD